MQLIRFYRTGKPSVAGFVVFMSRRGNLRAPIIIMLMLPPTNASQEIQACLYGKCEPVTDVSGSAGTMSHIKHRRVKRLAAV